MHAHRSTRKQSQQAPPSPPPPLPPICLRGGRGELFLGPSRGAHQLCHWYQPHMPARVYLSGSVCTGSFTPPITFPLYYHRGLHCKEILCCGLHLRRELLDYWRKTTTWPSFMEGIIGERKTTTWPSFMEGIIGERKKRRWQVIWYVFKVSVT